MDVPLDNTLQPAQDNFLPCTRKPRLVWSGSPAAELLYTTLSSSWHMPSLYYSFTAGPAQFFALDTNDFSAAQMKWLARELKKSRARWKIVYGHHPPYVASRPPQDQDPRVVSTLMPILAGQADVYIAGHAHNLEH